MRTSTATECATLELVVRSLATGAVLQTVELPAESAAGIEDLDSDGRDELLVGVAHAGSGLGKALVLTGTHTERVGVAFGFGNGGSGPCPCANRPAPGTGCANSPQHACGNSGNLTNALAITFTP